jgi:hypothetical protein
LKPVPVRLKSDRHFLFQRLDMRRITSRHTAAALHLALLCSAGAPAEEAPQSFSADIVSLDAGGVRRGVAAKLHVANHKARIETGDASDGFFLSDTDAGTVLFVRSAQRLYVDARQSTLLTRIFVPVDPHDPCREWQAAAATAGVPSTGEWHCEAVERGFANHHEIVEYRVVTSDRQSNYGWVDPTIGFPVKWQAADGKMFALENILLQAQPESLFSIPSDYRKLDPQALLERIKHSDVWAEPSK